MHCLVFTKYLSSKLHVYIEVNENLPISVFKIFSACLIMYTFRTEIFHN